jgi:hypothetical protein
MADFELPDQQALIDAFLDGLCKESGHEFLGLSHLLASLPDPSLSQGQVEAVEVRENVAEECRRLLHRDGTPRDRCKAEVCYIRSKYVIY